MKWCRKPCAAPTETRARPLACWVCRATRCAIVCQKSASLMKARKKVERIHCRSIRSFHSESYRGLDPGDPQGRQEAGQCRNYRNENRDHGEGQRIIVTDSIEFTAQHS